MQRTSRIFTSARGKWRMVHAVAMALASACLPGFAEAATAPTLTAVAPNWGYTTNRTTVMLHGSDFYPVWYNTNWGYRFRLTIPKSQVAGRLTNFPVMVQMTADTLRTVANGGRVGKANGGDLLFTSDTGTNKLSHEIERYVGETGEMLAWVRVPLITPTNDVELYLYYGNAASTNQWNAGDTWTNSYAGVWHFASNLLDSTTNASLGVNKGSLAVDGALGRGISFTNYASYVQITNSARLENIQETNYTLTAWYKVNEAPSAVPDLQYGVIAKQGWPLGLLAGTNASMVHVVTGNTNVACGVEVEAGTYHHLAGVVNKAAGTVRIYVDGVLAATNRFTANLATREYAQVLWRFGIADPTNATTRYQAKADMDEARIIATALAPEWILTEYRNQSAPGDFCMAGEVDALSGWASPTGKMQVTFGGSNAASIVYVNSTNIQVQTPTNRMAGPVDVTVRNPSGQTLTLTDGFLYVVNPRISGQVVDADSGEGVSGFKLKFSGIASNTVATSTGTYVQTLPYLYSGAVSSGWGGVMSPLKRTYSNVTEDIANEDYTWSAGEVPRIPVTVVYSGPVLTNRAVAVRLNTASLIAANQMQSNGGDIRFYDSDGTTPLSYWLESGLNTTNTLIWVKVPLVPEDGKTIYMTLANSSLASQSSMTNVFSALASPRNIMWLAANRGTSSSNNNAAVSVWQDLTGHGNYATQSVAASRPLYIANAVNAMPALRFDGTNDFLGFVGTQRIYSNSVFSVHYHPIAGERKGWNVVRQSSTRRV